MSEVWRLESGCCFCCWVFCCCCYVKIAQPWCSTRKDLKQIGSGHILIPKETPNGYSRCLGVKAGDKHSCLQHIYCLLSVKLRFSSVFVFLHFVVNLIEDERALQSCSTTITSLSVSRSAGNDVFLKDSLLQMRNEVCSRKIERGPFYLLLC